jgi:hypothetical protein
VSDEERNAELFALALKTTNFWIDRAQRYPDRAKNFAERIADVWSEVAYVVENNLPYYDRRDSR